MECMSGNNLCLRYFVKFLSGQGSDIAQQDETGKRSEGVGLCMGWDANTIQNDNVWGQKSRAVPTPLQPRAALLRLQHGGQFVPAPGALLWRWHFVTLDLDSDTQGHRAAPIQLLCPLRHLHCVWPCDVQAIKTIYVIMVSRAVMSQFSARLISTCVSNSVHSHFELNVFFQIIFF